MRSLRTRVHLTASRMHKWLSLIIGLQVLIWMTSGLVMSALPIERVRGEHLVDRKAQQSPIAGISAVRPLGELLSTIPGPVEELTLRMHHGRLMAEAKTNGRTLLFDPSTGVRMPRIAMDQAAEISSGKLEGWRKPCAQSHPGRGPFTGISGTVTRLASCHRWYNARLCFG